MIGPFTLDVNPISWSRPRPRNDAPGWYTPGADEYRDRIAEALMISRVPRRNAKGPFLLDVTFRVRRTKNGLPRKTDADNLLKSFLDALVALDVLADDTIGVVPEIRLCVESGETGRIRFSLAHTREP